MTPSEISTRNKILQATKELLTEKRGDPSMSSIAKRSGVSKSALYYFFQNKKELLASVMRALPEKLTADIQLISEKNLRSDIKLQEMLDAILHHFHKENAISQYIFRQIFSQDEELLRMIFTERKKGVALIQGVIEEGIRDKIFRPLPPEKTVEIVAGFLDFIGMCYTMPCPSDESECSWNPKALCEHLIILLKK